MLKLVIGLQMHNLQPDSWIGNWTVPVKCTTTSIWPLYLQFIYNLTNNLQFAQIGNWTVPVKCTTAEWEHIVFWRVRGISILYFKGLFIEKFLRIMDILNDLVNTVLACYHLGYFWAMRTRCNYSPGLNGISILKVFSLLWIRGIFREVARIMDILNTSDLHRLVTEMHKK